MPMDTLETNEQLENQLTDTEPMHTSANEQNNVVQADPGRVLRYLSQDIDIYTKPSISSSPIGNLARGDKILVIFEGEWAKISETMYVPSAALTQHAVPRTKKKFKWNQSH